MYHYELWRFDGRAFCIMGVYQRFQFFLGYGGD